MVFRGRPSKACSRCRSRRLRCDLRPGSCGACLRANEPCSGYRNVPKLRIQDETESIHRKFLAPCVESLQYPVELQARDVFFAHYVSPRSRGWDFLIQMPRSIPSYLTASLDAVCLAFLAQRRMSSSLLSRARSEYSTALRTMNEALPSSTVNAKHYMLTSSMCLDLFEKLTNTGPGGKEFWLGHIKGSLALVQALGLENLKDPMSLRLLVRLVANCTISSVASATAIPSALLEVRSHLERHADIGTDPKWKLTALMGEYAFLRSRIANSSVSLDECIIMAWGLDLKLMEWSQSMTKGWLPEIQGAADVFPRREIYPDRHVTQAWNTIRLARILLHEFLLQHDKSDHKHKIIAEDGLYGLSVDIIAAMADDICATILQYTDASSQSGDSRLAALSQQNTDSGKHMDSFETLNCYSLLFPLYVVGRSKWTSSCRKAWAMEQLERIGKSQCIPKALELTHLIEESSEPEPWPVYAMLGGYGFAA